MLMAAISSIHLFPDGHLASKLNITGQSIVPDARALPGSSSHQHIAQRSTRPSCTGLGNSILNSNPMLSRGDRGDRRDYEGKALIKVGPRGRQRVTDLGAG